MTSSPDQSNKSSVFDDDDGSICPDSPPDIPIKRLTLQLAQIILIIQCLLNAQLHTSKV